MTSDIFKMDEKYLMLCYKTINLKPKPLRVTNLSVNELIQQLSKKLEPLFSTADQPIIVGIETGGYLIAESLYKNLQPETELGKLNITFYRDDFTKTGLHPTVKPSSLPTNIDGKTINFDF